MTREDAVQGTLEDLCRAAFFDVFRQEGGVVDRRAKELLNALYGLGVAAGLEEAAVIAAAEEERLSLDSARYDAEAKAERLAAAIRRRKEQTDE